MEPFQESPLSPRKNLKLVFVREIDRWSHRFVMELEGTIILSSCEGNANDDWPPSPPLQEVDRHPIRTNQLAILGVGKSGQSHWSASFETGAIDSKSIKESPASFESALDHGGVRIELACLNGENFPRPNPNLGSCYRLADQIEGIRTDTGTIQLRPVDRSLGNLHESFDMIVSPLSGDGWGTELQVTVNELMIRPTRISSEPRKPTRWGYWIGFSGV